MSVTREITPETGALGSRTLQDQGDTRLTAIARAAGAFLAELWRAWAAARYAYRKARKTSRPYSAKLPVGDPILSRLDDGQGAPEDHMPQDEANLILYKTEGGRYFTDSFLKTDRTAGIAAGGRITFASEISDERAEELCTQLDALELEVELSENERLLRQLMRRHLTDRYAT